MNRARIASEWTKEEREWLDWVSAASGFDISASRLDYGEVVCFLYRLPGSAEKQAVRWRRMMTENAFNYPPSDAVVKAIQWAWAHLPRHSNAETLEGREFGLHQLLEDFRQDQAA